MTLQEFFHEHNRVALAFSGGVDSSYLLWAAVQAGADVTAYYVNAQFQPAFELEDAEKIAAYCGARMKVLTLDVLKEERVVENPQDRCYYCKQAIFSAILAAAAADGYTEVLDGTNASDEEGDRPGMRALKELKVFSPLRMAGLTKDEIRRLSKEAGLFTWNKPAYACLATRIPTGMRITAELLERTEAAEEALFAMGFSDFRVRTRQDGSALVQVTQAQTQKAKDAWEEIAARLGALYPAVMLDDQPRG
ncbi:MAG: ATP-dependent sacrificial sulfur transferase LarE [Lachnospiraceae bacterium]|nr:ATP-dependent sacrificial sulfur transferase LarE [Lachnospiraceae bacterium]